MITGASLFTENGTLLFTDYTYMLNARMQEISQASTSPLIYAVSDYGDYVIAKTKNAFSLTAGVKDGRVLESIKFLINEIERVKRYGFITPEYERVMQVYLNSLERRAKDHSKLSNNYYVNKLQDYFLNGDPLLGAEAEYELAKEIALGSSVDQINNHLQKLLTAQSLIILASIHEKEGVKIPNHQELLYAYNEALKDDIKPYTESFSTDPLLKEIPTPGMVLSQCDGSVKGTLEWHLSNGARVVLFNTDYREDQILFSAVSSRGYSSVKEQDVEFAKAMGDIISLGGVAEFSSSDLRKKFIGKDVLITSSIDLASSRVSASTTLKDIETFMQMLYLTFSSPRMDKDAFLSYKDRMINQFEFIESQPTFLFLDKIQNIMYNNNPYYNRMNFETLINLDYEKVFNLANDQFVNAADFTFIFVGNIDTITLKPLLERYIASLPSTERRIDNCSNVSLMPVAGGISKSFETNMQLEKTTIYSSTWGYVNYNLENVILSEMVQLLFDMVFAKSIREEEGGTYGVRVSMPLNYYPQGHFIFSFMFDTDKKLKDKLLAKAYKEVDNLIDNGIDPLYFYKIREYLHKKQNQYQDGNSYWLGIIVENELSKQNLGSEYETVLDSITIEKLHSFIKSNLIKDNRIEIVMSGVLPE